MGWEGAGGLVGGEGGRRVSGVGGGGREGKWVGRGVGGRKSGWGGGGREGKCERERVCG